MWIQFVRRGAKEECKHAWPLWLDLKSCLDNNGSETDFSDIRWIGASGQVELDLDGTRVR